MKDQREANVALEAELVRPSSIRLSLERLLPQQYQIVPRALTAPAVSDSSYSAYCWHRFAGLRVSLPA